MIQKYLGDGPKLVRELFRVAEEHAPAIVFIDEIDAVGTKRRDAFAGTRRGAHALSHTRALADTHSHAHARNSHVKKSGTGIKSVILIYTPFLNE